jgi:hypothetical protein
MLIGALSEACFYLAANPDDMSASAEVAELIVQLLSGIRVSDAPISDRMQA